MELLRARRPGGLPVLDTVLAVVLCVLAVGGLVTGAVDEHPLVVTLPIAALSTVLVAWRTRFPLPVAALIAGMAIAQTVLANGESRSLWSLVVFLVMSYTVGAECDEGTALLGLGMTMGSQFLCQWLDHGSDYPFDALVFGGVWLFGRGTRSWRKRATYAEQHRHDLARIAVADERTRIARELHDVVAHGLSVIAVQADAAEAALQKDPGLAAAPMRAIRSSARDALGDMRQLLHVLRADEDEPVDVLAPARGIADLPRLVAEMQESGAPLTAELGRLGSLSSGTELTVYRVVQEGLTNARKHAGDVPASLRVVREDGQICIEVVNSPTGRTHVIPGDSSGLGLVGVRERALAAGGRVESGQTSDGGFRLAVWLPVHDTEEMVVP
ncbi:sensor histidine kinase [Flexivirga caeni]|uniref:histidine kinase n=1 Tax=Flexivirga caeni TaxID=2294115 RepID=A0A3M9MIM8_9MICO|nr:histidine kinase [Flexivirga caeni]RNI25356.1 hypothetical protein EFY87_01630 [Flexivirga caeni]